MDLADAFHLERGIGFEILKDVCCGIGDDAHQVAQKVLTAQPCVDCIQLARIVVRFGLRLDRPVNRCGMGMRVCTVSLALIRRKPY